MQRDVLMKNWNFKSKISKYKKMICRIIQSNEMKIGKLYQDDGRLMRSFTKAHINPGFHLKIEPTCRKIEEKGYKWTNMENSVHNFYIEWEKW